MNVSQVSDVFLLQSWQLIEEVGVRMLNAEEDPPRVPGEACIVIGNSLTVVACSADVLLHVLLLRAAAGVLFQSIRRKASVINHNIVNRCGS